MNIKHIPVTGLRKKHFGLSNELFCNTSRHTAKVTTTAITIRGCGGNEKGNPEGLQVARAKVQESGYNGKMSRATRSKVTGIISAWVGCIKARFAKGFSSSDAAARKLTFVTLTLPSQQQHTDNYIKRHMLARFLLDMQRNQNAVRNFWRAEPQKNGNLHFHIIFDVSIDWRIIRTAWNKVLADNGYIDAYREAQKEYHAGGFNVRPELLKNWTLQKQINAYAYGVRTNWSDPNSTDIHRLEKIKNCAAYVCKYVSKEGGARKVDGRIWGCTDQLRELALPEMNCTEELILLMNQLSEAGDVRKIACEHATIYKGDIIAIFNNYAPEAIEAINLYYVEMSNWLLTFTEKKYKHRENNFQP